MKRYCIKSRAGKVEYFDILAEDDEGYQIRLTRLSEGNNRTVEESMSRHLFNICINTGYIFELESAAVA